MSFFVCLVRPSGGPIGSQDRGPVVEHLASRGLDGASGWQDVANLAVLTRRSGSSGPRLARSERLVGVGDVRLDHPDEVAARLPDLPSAGTHLDLALRWLETQGAESVGGLLGDFAFLGWDPAKRQLVAIRDAFGVKPLFHTSIGPDLLAFSSHASLLGIRGSVSEEYVAKYFVRSVAEEATIFESVEVVPAAHTLSVADGRWSLRRYWSPDAFDDDPGRCGRHGVEEFRMLFSEAVRRRLAGQGAVVSELSGGLDTSSIVAMSSYLKRFGAIERGLAGTITYADSFGSGDESEYVDAVVQASGVRNEQVRDSWPWRADDRGPMCTEKPGPSTLFWFRDRKRNEILHNAGALALLSGFGGDHLLEGNLRFFADRLAGGSIRRTSVEMAHWAASQQGSFWKFAFGHGLVPLLPRLRSRLLSRAQHVRIPAWVASDFRRRTEMETHLRRTTVPRLAAGSLPRYRAGNVELIEFLACSLPRDQPFVSYERRYPFLYRPLVELTLSMPPELKVRPGVSKVALREAMQGVLPELVRTRLGKGGVNTRMLWALNHEHRLIERMLRDPLLAQMGYVDAERLRDAWAGARTGELFLTVPLYNTLALETWLLIETGRWPRLEEAPSSNSTTPHKERKNHAKPQAAVPEARHDRSGPRGHQDEGYGNRILLGRQPERRQRQPEAMPGRD